MASSQEMPRVDMSKEFTRLTASDKHFVEKLEQLNKKRSKEVRLLRGKNKLVGLLAGATTLGIYFYTISAVQQERFLDDFDEVPSNKSKS